MTINEVLEFLRLLIEPRHFIGDFRGRLIGPRALGDVSTMPKLRVGIFPCRLATIPEGSGIVSRKRSAWSSLIDGADSIHEGLSVGARIVPISSRILVVSIEIRPHLPLVVHERPKCAVGIVDGLVDREESRSAFEAPILEEAGVLVGGCGRVTPCDMAEYSQTRSDVPSSKTGVEIRPAVANVDEISDGVVRPDQILNHLIHPVRILPEVVHVCVPVLSQSRRAIRELGLVAVLLLSPGIGEYRG